MQSSKKSWLAPGALIAPVVVLLIALFVVPQITLLRESLSAPAPFGFASYVRFLGDGYYLAMLARTFLVAAAVTVLCILLGFPLAFLLARSESRFAPLMLLVTTFPLWVSAVVRSFAWMVLFFRDGLLSRAMQATGLVAPQFQLIGTMTGVLIALAQVMLPLMVVSLFGVIRAIDRDLENAAMNLGASPAETVFLVTIPQAKGGILAGSLLIFSLSAGAFATPSLIGGARANLMAVGIQEQTMDLLDWPFAGAMAMILLVTSASLAIVYGRIMAGDRR